MSYRRPSRIAVFPLVREGDVDQVFLRPVPGGPNLALVGTAALIWTVAATGAADVALGVAEVVDEPVEMIRADVERYLLELVEQGLLVPDSGVPRES